ncbi:uncharacterized protein N7483_003038 [Penicillium malachiteum]|uniref:uncharacterized protein n=1 Tax=Penicillium malachiteum TaxID=1324776 RepID=UPI00254699E3|nr:uncharacterized protein N7483_003038 [Penicillium malachiteum]KAJ5737913.1 hypothetical protein N7483_003038 [Penicillium malachiteum]
MISITARVNRVSLSRKSFIAPRNLCSCTRATRATSYTLNTGVKIPSLGFGRFRDPDSQGDTVSQALRKGMRLIDTARVYDVEEQVGKGIKKSGVPREEIFLGTKLWCSDYHPDGVERALDDSLRELDTPYVDLLLMHYPCTFKRGSDQFPRDADGRIIHGETTFVDTWKAMEKMTKTGRVKGIGVSNFSQGEIQTLLNETSTPGLGHELITFQDPCRSPDGSSSLLATERIQQMAKGQGNPRRPVQPARKYERFLSADWVVQGSCAYDARIDQPILKEIGDKYGKSAVQVVLAWGINSGRSVIPKSVVDWQIEQNLEADFELQPKDMS